MLPQHQRIVKPRVDINGHIHLEGYKTYTFLWNTLYIYISSDQKEKCYLVLDTGTEDRGMERSQAVDTIDTGNC